MPEILHLALGDSAAGCLRVASSNLGMPGFVFCISDDLSHGPLDDGRSRADYLRSCFEGYDDWSIDLDDAFEPWGSLVTKIREANVDTVVVWAGDNVSEETFLCMACWWLREQPVRILRPIIKSKHSRNYVAVQTPAELADNFPSAIELSDAVCSEKEATFKRLCDDHRTLRHWNNGRIETVQADFYDHLLYACCTKDWRPAARLVGAAMGSCDGHNAMSDLFFSSRLRWLIKNGIVDADGNPNRLREYSVRVSEN